MGLRSPEAPAANGWGLLTNVYIPVLHQRGLKTLGKPLLLLDLSFCFCKNGMWAVLTLRLRYDLQLWLTKERAGQGMVVRST